MRQGPILPLYTVSYTTIGGSGGASLYYARSAADAVSQCAASIGHCIRKHTLSARTYGADQDHA